MSSNAESPRRDFGDSLQLKNWILDSDVTCRMAPDISVFIPCSLVETDRYIKVVYGRFVTAKQNRGFHIKMRDDNGKTFIATLYNVLFATDLCGQIFSIITLIL